MKYGLSNEQLNEIIEIISSYNEIEKAFIFGSRAIDTYKEASDVDIAICGEAVNMHTAGKLKDHLEDETYLPFFFDIISYNSITNENLKQHIQNKGKVIFQRNKEEWGEVKLGELLDLITGFAFKSKNFLEYQVEGSLPVIKIKNVANGDVNFENVVYHQFHDSLGKYKLSKGDVLIAMTGNHPHAMTQIVGDVSIYKLETEALLNQRIGKIITKGDNDLVFFYYFFKDKKTHRYLASQSSGSANQANISKGDILSLTSEIPKPKEQKAIAEVLSSLDDKINLIHHQNKTLEQMAETLFRQWFVEEAKEDWEEILITNLFEVRDGTHDSPSKKDYGKKLITSKHIKTNKIDFESAYFISDNDFDLINNRSKVEHKDILFSMIGTIGNIYIEEKQYINYAIKNIGLFKTSQNTDWCYFLYLWLKSRLG